MCRINMPDEKREQTKRNIWCSNCQEHSKINEWYQTTDPESLKKN